MDFLDSFSSHFNYVIYVVLMMIGMWAMIAKNNLIKKLIGMSIFQTAIILFYVSLGVKTDAGIPIVHVHHGEHHEAAQVHEGDKKESHHGKDELHPKIDPDQYANPLPHVLMLTAIVVGVSTLGVALAVSQQIFREYGTLEESEILTQIKQVESDG